MFIVTKSKKLNILRRALDLSYRSDQITFTEKKMTKSDVENEVKEDISTRSEFKKT